LFDSVRCAAPYLAGVTILCGDVRDFEQVSQAVTGKDIVVHLACLPVGPSLAHPIQDFEVNALGTVQVLKAARDHGVQRVIYTSTSEVYGRPQYRPMDEAHPTEPVTPYGASKLCGEIYCRAFERVYGLKSVVLRFFNLYGPAVDGRPRSTVDAIFVRRVLAGQPPVIRGNPEHARDFVHVRDAARAVWLAIQSEEALGQVINIGSGTATTLEQLAHLIIGIAEVDLEPVPEGPVEKSVIFQADVRLARRLLQYEPSVSLADGLCLMLQTKPSGGSALPGAS
jgi:UDP-glucose 4-epimerase